MMDQKFLKIMQNYPQCFCQTRLPPSEKLTVSIDDCMVLLIKSDQKPRKKSDIHKNIYQKNQR